MIKGYQYQGDLAREDHRHGEAEGHEAARGARAILDRVLGPSAERPGRIGARRGSAGRP